MDRSARSGSQAGTDRAVDERGPGAPGGITRAKGIARSRIRRRHRSLGSGRALCGRVRRPASPAQADAVRGTGAVRTGIGHVCRWATYLWPMTARPKKRVKYPPFTALPDLAAARLGGAVNAANGDVFGRAVIGQRY